MVDRLLSEGGSGGHMLHPFNLPQVKTGKDLKLDWSAYENSIILTAGKELKVHQVEVSKIFKIEDPPEEGE